MKLNGDTGHNLVVNRYYQEKKQLRKDLFKWSRQTTEYCAFESFVEYLLPADKFKLFDKNYQEYCEKLKESEMFECNDTIIDEELLLNDCMSKELKQQEYEEINFYDENFICDEPLDLSKKSRMNEYEDDQYLKINESNNGKSSPSSFVDNQKILKSSQFSSKSQNQIVLANSLSCRRSYSKEVLDKALADIQSGRIGTRRASVLYGIPRSTLRNKVFRLNNQKQHKQESHVVSNKNEHEPKFNEFKDKILGNLSFNYAYEKLFLSTTEANQQLKEDLISYTKNSTNLLQPPVQQYLSGTMLKILNEVVNEKINPPDNSKKTVTKETISKSNQIVEQSKSKPHIATKNVTKLPQFQQQQQQQLSLKQKRAKRGQYRKYESDQLNKAVDAVINGLMSVHKAGSHFGVPHSTLEYKVKERNMKFSSGSSTPTTSSTQPKQNNAKQSSTNENKTKTKSSNSNKIESYNSSDNKIPFQYPPANSQSAASLLATNYFSASELLRKLYEGVNCGGAKY